MTRIERPMASRIRRHQAWMRIAPSAPERGRRRRRSRFAASRRANIQRLRWTLRWTLRRGWRSWGRGRCIRGLAALQEACGDPWVQSLHVENGEEVDGLELAVDGGLTADLGADG